MTVEREAMTLDKASAICRKRSHEQGSQGLCLEYEAIADAIDAHLSRAAKPYCYTIEQRNGLSQGEMCRTVAECEASPTFDPEIDHIIPLFTHPPEPAKDASNDDRILWGIVANAGRLSDARKPRWAHVSDATGQGSTRSAELCRRFGFNPDEYLGGDAAMAQESGDAT